MSIYSGLQFYWKCYEVLKANVVFKRVKNATTELDLTRSFYQATQERGFLTLTRVKLSTSAFRTKKYYLNKLPATRRAEFLNKIARMNWICSKIDFVSLVGSKNSLDKARIKGNVAEPVHQIAAVCK